MFTMELFLWIELFYCINIAISHMYFIIFCCIHLCGCSGTAISTISLAERNSGFPGMSFAASALFAMKQFNERNATIVPELANYTDCTVKFDLERTKIIDSGTVTHIAAQSFLSMYNNSDKPSALIGTFDTVPATDISVMSSGGEIPFVVTGVEVPTVFETKADPYVLRMFPLYGVSSKALIDFLATKGRTNYFSYLYSITEQNMVRQERLDFALDSAGIESFFQPYLSNINPWGNGVRGISQTLKLVKDRGYRTIIVSMADADIEGPELALAAEELGMNNGDYFWVWLSKLNPGFLSSQAPYVDKLLEGSAWLVPVAKHFYAPENSTYIEEWKKLDGDFVNEVNKASPLQKGSVAYSQVPRTFFQDYLPEYGSGFLYDSVMVAGMGACEAQKQGTAINNTMIRNGIYKVNFTGTTGVIYFGNGTSTGSRVDTTFIWGIVNVVKARRKEGDRLEFHVSDVRESNGSKWLSLIPFVFANRSLEGPPLRNPPNQNYLKRGLRGVGLMLMSVVIFLSLFTSVFVFYFRNHRTIRAAQPLFMHLLALGSIISVSAIFPLSVDESYGYSDRQLDRACMSIPWLATIGSVISK
jgi:Receptor family ligand binding region